MPEYIIKIDAPDLILYPADLANIEDMLYDELVKDSEPGSENIRIVAEYNQYAGVAFAQGYLK